MLTEAKASGLELGDERDRRRGDVLARARAGRALRPRRRPPRAGGAARGRRAHASRSCSTSPSTTPRRWRSATGDSRRGRGGCGPIARVEPPAHGRDPSGVYGIQMFAVRREQGRLAELARGASAAATRPRRRLASGPRRVARRARHGGRGTPRAAAVAADGLDPSSATRSGSPRCVPHGRVRGRRRRDAAAALPRARAARRAQRDDRPPRRCYGAADRYLGMLARRSARTRPPSSTSSARSSSTGAWARHLARHTLFEYGRMLLLVGRDDARRRPSLLGRGGRARRAHRHARSLARDRGARGVRPLPARCRTASRRARSRSCASSRGLTNRDIGRRAAISEHTAANHVRSILRKTGCANRTEAATYAHRHGLAA